MRLAKFFIIIALAAFFVGFTNSTYAKEHKQFITIVHPVRGRPMWSELQLLKTHAKSTHSRGLPATWLVQYNVLDDEDVIDMLKSFKESDDEIGVFLEVSETLATDSETSYILGDGDWARTDKVFFSGYELDARKRMSDVLFEKFKSVFGSYPKSVGAWYIDSVTLEYIYKKYGVIAAIDCADQYATDGYQKWGKPWGVPYYPSRWNTLIPAQSESTKLPVVKIQWALRDPKKGYGIGIPDSTYSLQANDYVGHHDLDTSYFSEILNYYLDTKNKFSQATVGLEAGTESRFLDELDRQMAEVMSRQEKGVQVVTMSDFSKWYSNEFPTLSPEHVIASKDAIWYSSNFYRIGLVIDSGVLKIRDLRFYDDTYLEDDVVAADKREKLYRSIFSPIDDLLFGNGRVLAKNVKSFEIERNGENVSIYWKSNVDDGIIRLTKDKVLVNDRAIVDASHAISLGWYRNFWRRLSRLAAWFARIDKPRYYPIPLRYTTIGNKKVIGIQTEKERIFAISFPPFRIGTSYFPFQNLVRFKTWPFINIPSLFFASDSSLFADWFLQNHESSNFKIFDRDELSHGAITLLEENDWRRVFENSVVSVWQHALSSSNSAETSNNTFK